MLRGVNPDSYSVVLTLSIELFQSDSASFLGNFFPLLIDQIEETLGSKNCYDEEYKMRLATVVPTWESGLKDRNARK